MYDSLPNMIFSQGLRLNSAPFLIILRLLQCTYMHAYIKYMIHAN